MLVLTPLDLSLQAMIVLLVSIAAVYDFRWRRIPNWLTGSGAIAGLTVNMALFGMAGLAGSAKALVFGFAVYFVLYILRAMGAGDVKLMAAVGAIAGPERWFAIFLITSLVGGITALAVVLVRKRFVHTLWNVAFVFSQLLQMRSPALAREELDVQSEKAMTLPAGVRIAAGVFGFLVISGLGGR